VIDGRMVEINGKLKGGSKRTNVCKKDNGMVK